jgi:hypothetical protein
MDRHLQAARSLQRYVVEHHWKDHILVGPDPGIRFNYRIGRFIKSAVGRGMWRDDLYYIQAQGYWVLANLELHRRTQAPAYLEVATQCARSMMAHQAEDGSWAYPNPEWKGRIATAEGTWGALGLVEAHKADGDPAPNRVRSPWLPKPGSRCAA